MSFHDGFPLYPRLISHTISGHVNSQFPTTRPPPSSTRRRLSQRGYNHRVVSLKTVLKAERVMLNFIQRLSGIATTTSHFVARLNNPKIHVLDTRKTTPLYRFLERQAVVAGGGENHRLNLSDMVLLKENHLTQLANEGRLHQLHQLMETFKKTHPNIWIEIEIETIEQLQTMDLTLADVIMLDNFNLQTIEPAVKLCKILGFKALIEVSGNVTLDNIGRFSHLPIDRISVGSLTHSHKALDLSLLIQ